MRLLLKKSSLTEAAEKYLKSLAEHKALPGLPGFSACSAPMQYLELQHLALSTWVCNQCPDVRALRAEESKAQPHQGQEIELLTFLSLC